MDERIDQMGHAVGLSMLVNLLKVQELGRWNSCISHIDLHSHPCLKAWLHVGKLVPLQKQSLLNQAYRVSLAS